VVQIPSPKPGESVKTFKVTLKDRPEPEIINAEKCKVSLDQIYFGDRDTIFFLDNVISVEKLSV
jgi:hypothetical protein